ncbi:hypothetical protein [Leucobacter manosquensis]|uniref:DUF4274 domain-containing protein n=1 Tax=Leucobacter manosquensis TaxID=2810611 RepID=A0ABS5M591_9MICO|nr:hypothetical protein [Leucobacter manosquensis]MBS3182369.1 hypothetical protein [Leucobacter manosquensis]
MHDQESLDKLQQSWPETTDYLRRVGQVNNDLAVLREISQRDEYEASLTWLDHLAVGVEDLTKQPNPVTVLWFLHRDGMEIASASQVDSYREIREEFDQEQIRLNGESSGLSWDVLDEGPFNLPDSDEQQLWALPELQQKFLAWADQTATRHDYQGPALTLAQGSILFNVCLFLEQEPEQSPGWAEECLRSALSSDFFEKAANPTK